MEGLRAVARGVRTRHGRGLFLRRDLRKPPGRAGDGRLQGRELVGTHVRRAGRREGPPRGPRVPGRHPPARGGVRQPEARRLRARAAVAVRGRRERRRELRRRERTRRAHHGRERQLRLGRLHLHEMGEVHVPAFARLRRHPRRHRPRRHGSCPHRGCVRAQQAGAPRHRHVRLPRERKPARDPPHGGGGDRRELVRLRAREEPEDGLREESRHGRRARRRGADVRLQRRRQGGEALGDTRFASLRHAGCAEGREGRARGPARRAVRLPLPGGEGRGHGRAALAQRAAHLHPLWDQLGLLAVERHVPHAGTRAPARGVGREARHEHAQLPPLPGQRGDSQRRGRDGRDVLRGAGRVQHLPLQERGHVGRRPVRRPRDLPPEAPPHGEEPPQPRLAHDLQHGQRARLGAGRPREGGHGARARHRPDAPDRVRVGLHGRGQARAAQAQHAPVQPRAEHHRLHRHPQRERLAGRVRGFELPLADGLRPQGTRRDGTLHLGRGGRARRAAAAGAHPEAEEGHAPRLGRPAVRSLVPGLQVVPGEEGSHEELPVDHGPHHLDGRHPVLRARASPREHPHRRWRRGVHLQRLRVDEGRQHLRLRGLLPQPQGTAGARLAVHEAARDVRQGAREARRDGRHEPLRPLGAQQLRDPGGHVPRARGCEDADGEGPPAPRGRGEGLGRREVQRSRRAGNRRQVRRRPRTLQHPGANHRCAGPCAGEGPRRDVRRRAGSRPDQREGRDRGRRAGVRQVRRVDRGARAAVRSADGAP